MRRPFRRLLPLLLLGARPLPADPDLRAWWATTAALSGDAMEGRDTGSAAYARAAALVAARFAAAGLQPAGEGGGFFQRVAMEELRVTDARVDAGGVPFRFLHDITVGPTPDMPDTIAGALAYRGYCAADALGNVRGRIVICHGTHRPGLPDEAARLAAVRAAGAAGLVTVADPGFAVEPPRWPVAYARAVWLAGKPPEAGGPVRFTLNADALARLVAGSGRDAARLIAAGAAGEPLPAFDPPRPFRARFRLGSSVISDL